MIKDVTPQDILQALAGTGIVVISVVCAAYGQWTLVSVGLGGLIGALNLTNKGTKNVSTV